MTVTTQDISKLRLFREVSEDSRVLLAQSAIERRLKAGQSIMTKGDDSPVYFVLEGRVRTFLINPSGRRQVLVELGGGSGFNLPTAFIPYAGSPASVVALEDVRLLRYDKHSFRALVISRPELASVVLEDLSKKLHHFAQLTQDLSLRSVRQRLAHFLLEGEVEKKITHEALAARLGTVREVVSRTLRSLAKAGMIEVGRGRLSVVDPERLENELYEEN